MAFENLKARRHLLDKGYVYTLRCFPHREGEDNATWTEGGSPFKRVTKVIITLLKELVWIGKSVPEGYEIIDESPLEKFVRGSGFSSLHEWADAVCVMNHINELPNTLYLYSVQLVI